MRSRLQRKKVGSEGSSPAPARTAPIPSRSGAALAVGPHYAAGPTVALAAPVQAKVTIGTPGDRYEREADSVADRVTRGESGGAVSTLPPGGLAKAGAQRATDDTVQELPVQREADEPVQEEAEEPVQEEAEESVQEEPEEPVQELAVQRESEEPVQAEAEEPVQEESEEPVQEEAEEPVQEESEEPVQEESEEPVQEESEEPVQERAVQREPDESVQEEAEEPVQELPVQRAGDEEVQEDAAARGAPRSAPPAPRSGMEGIAARGIGERGPGEAMQPSTRRVLERGLGTDLGDVRVHADVRSQEVAGALRARAFTHKNHIWLGRGESQDDVRLMAHETTHVLQQDGVTRRAPADDNEELAAAPESTAASPVTESSEDGDRGEAPPGTTAAESGSGAEPAAEPSSGEPTAGSAGSAGSESGSTASDAVTGEGAEGAEKEGGEAETEKAAGAEEAEAEAGAEAETPAPEEDPRFQGVMKRLDQTAGQARTHEPAADKVADAQAAVEAPANDQSSRAQASQVDTMSQQEAKKPETDSFLALLRQKLAEIAPRNMEETEKFKKEGKAAQLKQSMTGEVTAKKDASAQGIKSAAEAEPDASAQTPKEVVPLPAEPADKPPPNLRAGDVLPEPKTESEVSAKENTDKAEQLMADNDLDEEQLEKANEPQFSDALASKKELEEHAEKVPEQYRETEQAYLAEAEAGAEADEKSAKGDMKGTREKAKAEVGKGQDEAKKKEEEERKRVADEIQALYEKTRKKVEDKLAALDGEVDQMFDTGEKAARDKFESYVDRRMSAYKYDRYLNRIGGGILWAKDKLFGMPDEVNEFYEEGRDLYLADMDKVLVSIADTVEKRLQEAKDEIERGKEEIRTYVEELPKNLQKAGEEAESGLTSKFEELEQGVDAKKEELAQKMAQRYKESREKLDARIEELKAANQGLLSGFIAKIKEIIRILKEFKDRVMGLLTSGADTLRKIIKDPIGFLKQLLNAVKKGFGQFKDNILTHLKKGLFSWLFGTLAKAGVQVPSEFSIKGIFGLVMQILGLTASRIRQKLVKLVGAKNVERVEAAWSVVSTLLTEGPAGLWNKMKEYLTDLKETVMGGIRDFIITQVVKQAVIWLISLFNPAAALLKAIKLIYDVIMFFVENIERILDLVTAVIESVAKIVAGNIGAAANWIESAMGRTVPIIISFLARLLGLGGISGKIKNIIKKIQKRVDKAVDKALMKVVKGLKKLLGKGKAAAKKAVSALVRFVYPKQKFKAGKKSHTFYFEEKGDKATPMVASRPQTFSNLLTQIEKDGGDPAKVKTVRSKISSLDALQDTVKTLRKQGRAAEKAADTAKLASINKKLEAEQKNVKGKIGEITPLLAELMAGEDLGASEATALPLVWPKPAALSYPTLYFGPKTKSHLPQEQLRKARFGSAPARQGIQQVVDQDSSASWDGKVQEFKPGTQKALPAGGPVIGLASDYMVAGGFTFAMREVGSSPGGSKLNDPLKRYGYSPGGEGLDADHVVERQLGGPDAIKNLWPLDAGINRASGGIIKRSMFDVSSGGSAKKVPMSVLKKRAQSGTPVWFKITSTS